MRKTSARHLAAQQRTSAAGWRIRASAPIARAQSSRPLPGVASSGGRKVDGIKWDGPMAKNLYLIPSDLPLIIHSSSTHCPLGRVLFVSEL